MAIANSDGSIILPVEVDTGGLDKGVNTIKKRAKTLDDAFKNVERTIASALIKGDTKTANLAVGFKKATEEVIKQSAKVEELRTKLAELESGEVSSPKLTKMQSDLEKTNTSIEKTKQEIAGLHAQVDDLWYNAFKTPNGEAIFTGAEQAEFDSLNAKLDTLEAKLEADQQKASELGENLRNAAGTATQEEIKKTSAELANAENKLDNLSTKAEIAGQKLNKTMEESGKATGGLKEKISSVGDGFGKIGTKLSNMAKRVFVFSVLTSGLRGVRSAISDVIMSDKSFRQSLAQLKASLWTAFAPIYSYIIPAIRALINGLNSAMTAINKLIALITRKSYVSLVANGQALYKQVKAYKDVASTAKSATKELAAFDEIDILSRDDTNSSNSEITPSFGAEIQENLSALASTVVGAAAVGLGLILMFAGHFLLGLGLVIAGGSIIWEEAPELSEELDVDMKTKLENICKIVGNVAFMLGIILLFVPGCFIYGLGLMALGVTALGYEEKLKNPDSDLSDLKNKLINIVEIVGLIAFFLGIILLFVPKCFLIGLGLMAKGAAALKITSVLSGDESKTALETFCTEHWKAIAVIGIIMVCVGIIILFTGHWRIGLAMIFVGIAALVTGDTFSGGEIKQGLHDFCTEHWKALYAIGIIMVCIGIAVLFTGHWKIGLCLITLGIADLVGTKYFEGEELKQKLTAFCDKYWDELKYISVVAFCIGIILLFTSAFPAGLALIALGWTGMHLEGSFSSDEIREDYESELKSFKEDLMALSWVCFILGVILLFVPGAQGVGIALMGAGAVGAFSSSSLSSGTLKSSVKGQLKEVQGTVTQGVNDINAEYAKIGQTSTSSVNVQDITSSNKTVSTYSTAANAVKYEVPALAKGTVLPGGMPYLAIVNDNPKGQPNIEAPAELIKQMAKEAYQEMGLANNQQQQIIKEEHYNLNQTELMTIMYKLVKGGERLNGTSLVKQGGI